MIRGADGERVVGMEDFHVGPYMTAVGAGEMLTEIRLRAAPRRGQRAREGRAPRGRLGDRRRVRRASGSTAARSPTPASRSARSASTTIHLTRAEELLRGQAPSEELFAQAGEIAVGGLLAERRRPRAGRLQAPPRGRPHPARAAPRDGARAARRRPDDERLDDRQRRARLARRRAAPAARPLHPRDARPHGHALGLRHVELRRLRRADRRPAGQVVHDARGDVRGPRDPHRRVARGRRRSSTRSSRASTSCTRCSAASARPGC